MAVIIQPSYGNPAARRHWRDTLDHPVRLSEPLHSATLMQDELRALLALHPAREALSWRATRAQDGKMATVQQGEVVLFTGKNHIRGIGEVGHSFQNAAFADTMSAADPNNGSWRNVYSLSFEPP